jgi:hypothetical protein
MRWRRDKRQRDNQLPANERQTGRGDNQQGLARGRRRGPWGGRGPEPGGNVLNVAAAARIAVSPTRTMEQRGTGDGGNKEEVDDQTIGKEMTATVTVADGRPFLGATAG